MISLIEKTNQTIEAIREKTNNSYEVGIILGTGLGGLVEEIDIDFQMDYSELPYFVTSTVEFHSGKLIFGTLNGKNVMVMQGRFHYYEGYSVQEITYPVRVMKRLGVETLIVSILLERVWIKPRMPFLE